MTQVILIHLEVYFAKVEEAPGEKRHKSLWDLWATLSPKRILRALILKGEKQAGGEKREKVREGWSHSFDTTGKKVGR